MRREIHDESQYRCACDWAALPMYTNLQEVRKERKKERRRKKGRKDGRRERSK